MKELVIRLKEDEAEIANIEVHDGERITAKAVGVADLFQMFLKNTVKGDEEPLQFLPKNCIATAPHRWSIYLPKRMNIHTYNGKDYYIPFPDMVLTMTEANGRLLCSHVVALKGNPSPTSEVFFYPFSHVYEDTHICFGSSPDLKSSEDVEKTVEIFYNSPNPGHLWKQHIAGVMEGKGYTELMEYLRELNEFPDEILVSSGKYLSGYLQSI